MFICHINAGVAARVKVCVGHLVNRQVRYNTIKFQRKDEVAGGVIRVNYHDGVVFSCGVVCKELGQIIYYNIIHMALKW